MNLVSIIVPCFNEQSTIHLMLDAIYQQDYPRDCLEVVIADGFSTDKTREKIQQYQADHPDLQVRVIDNPKRIIPAGLNVAIKEAKGDILVRLDGHSVPSHTYITKCVGNLITHKGDNVGGVWKIYPRSSNWQSESIAVAASHPLGVGDAHYRIGGKAQKVDTVPFGSFFQILIDQIGYFNESLLTNEDYEFNAKIRKNGGTVWFDPEIHSMYFSSASFINLGRQYYRYGFWKARMLHLHPETLRWRQALPPVFILTLLILGVVGFIWTLLWWLLVLELICYFSVLVVSSLKVTIRKKELYYLLGVPLAIMIMHFSWGSAFLWSLITLIKKNR